MQRVKISDISDSLAIPRPGVTRTVKEMEERCYLKKISSDEDARITYIEITVKGEELSEKYDKIITAAYADILMVFQRKRLILD